MSIESYLEKLLTIKRPEDENLFGIVGRMKSLLEFFKANKKYHSFAPFLQVYLHVTESVFREYLRDENSYDNFPKIEDVDIHFANLYFAPLKNYLLYGYKQLPWKSYYEYCEREDGKPFVQVLLGINAHINSDLVTTILDTDYNYHNDYFKVNNILLDVIPEMMRDLVLIYKDIYGLGGLVFHPITKYEFKHTVVKWRYDAWNNAQLIKRTSLPNAISHYHLETEKVGTEIVDIFEDMSHLSHLRDHIKELNSLEVGLHKMNLISMNQV